MGIFKLQQLMTVTLVVLGGFILTGCSASNQEGPFFYQLPMTSVDNTKAITSSTNSQLPVIWVEPIILSSQLASRNIAFQTSDVNYTLAQNHLWASSLEEQLVLALENHLSGALPEYFVSRQANSQADYRLQVSVTAFHPKFNGKVILSGRFNITSKSGVIISEPFLQEVSLSKDGYDETVRLLAALWQSEIERIANAIRVINK